MQKIYFLTAPLLEAEEYLRYGDCKIQLRGVHGYSYIEGPDESSIDDAFEFIFAIINSSELGIPGIRVVIRSKIEPLKLPDDPKLISSEQWTSWAFSRLPIHSIPVVIINSKQRKLIQNEIDSYYIVYNAGDML